MKWREDVFRKVVDNVLADRGIKSVLDIAGGQKELRDVLKPEKYVNVDMKKYSGIDTTQAFPDIECDLNTIEKIPVEDGSYDLVSMCHILEHLNWDTMHKIIEESQRISKRYILVGLPNEMLWFQRIRVLLGINTIGVTQYGHHYMFDLKEADKLMKKFKRFKVVKKFHVGKKIPASFLKNWTTWEVYYLLEKISK